MAELPLALRLPLHGSRLIEASAGTGKTWTIASLYVRLVLGHGHRTRAEDAADAAPTTTAFRRPLAPPDILVMTFTRAATQELAVRIRERLSAAARCFRGEDASGQADALLQALHDDYPPGEARERAAWRLEVAAQTMDEAAIHTIDAWCWKVLQGYASLTGALGELSPGGDVQALWQLAALDFWRNHVVPLDAQALQRVQAVWPNGQAWLKASHTLQGAPRPAPKGSLRAHMAQTQEQQQARLRQLASGWPERVDAMQAWLDGQTDKGGPHHAHWDGRTLAPRHYQRWLDLLRAWASDPQPAIAGWSDKATQRLQFSGLAQARKKTAPPLAPAHVPPVFAELQALLAELAALPSFADAITAFAAGYTQARWQALKAGQGVMDFADLLARVQQALDSPHGAVLRERLLAQYPVALIDEFQDTSPAQYAVFDAIYAPARNDPDHLLLLIGDPKQSIYGFRGADIYSYLAAKRATRGRHDALDTNFRSTDAMVAAVNQVFGQAEQRPGPGAFRFRPQDGGTDPDDAGAGPLPFVPVRAHGLQRQLCDGQGQPLAALTICTQAEARARDEAEAVFAECCAEQIACWLQPDGPRFAEAGGTAATAIPLQPGDIAILVHQRAHAVRLQQALRRRRLHAVYLSDRESVFASPEAEDLVRWLEAVAQPGHVPLARAAFATALLDLPLSQLQASAEQDDALDAQMELLQALHGVWRRQGVLPMLRQTIHRLGLARRWLAASDGRGERKLTNVLHLAELLQQASGAHEGEQSLIRHLVQHIHQAQAGVGGMAAEEQTVRLESDAQLIQIVTIHKSKGLQYPVVMLPFASHARFVKEGQAQPEDTGADAVDPLDGAAAPTDEERLREDLRLLYVALTRAQHLAWVGFPIHKASTRNAHNQLHRTALGYLLSGGEPLADEAWCQRIAAWQAPGLSLRATLAPPAQSIACTVYAPPPASTPWRSPAAYTAPIERHFAIASFSGLVRGISASAHPGSATAESPTGLEDDGLAVDTAIAQPYMWLPAGERGAADEPQVLLPLPGADGQAWHALRGSARLGDWVHQVLEWLQAEGFPPVLNSSQLQRIARTAAAAGFVAQTAVLTDWLQRLMAVQLPALPTTAVHAPAADGASTSWRLGDAQATLAEMEFWLPAQQAEAAALDAACRAHFWPGVPRPAIGARQWQGMLMGFADLVLEQGGRYWVLDYKTNRLGDSAASYHPAALRDAMLQHRYDLQAALYLYALHGHLRARLPGYRPERHLGGALYWFLRGVDHAQAGLLHLPAPTALLEQLEQSLGQPALTSHAG